MKNQEELNKITAQILDACITVHKEMGPGLLESIYEECLMKEFELRRIKALNQVPIPLFYKGYKLKKDFKADILIEDEVIIEIKSCEGMIPLYSAQIITYLKLADKRVGILVNFNEVLLKDGYKRFVNNF